MQKAQRHLSDVMGRAAPAYNRTGPAFFTEIAEHLLLRARVPSGADVLDVATGPGVLISRLGHRFPHAQAWLENAWSHGERRALEAMDDVGYTAFCAELPAALEPAREPDGFLHWRPEVIFAVGVKLEQG
jgi:hypothetical protein